MKVLLVDDNKKRSGEIYSLLTGVIGLSKAEVFFVENTQNAKNLLRIHHFDFLILDVVLPKRDEKPSAQYGLSLLNDIKKRPALRKPSKIVGITAHFEDIEIFRKSFEEHCEVIIEASNRNKEWKKRILEAIKFEFTKNLSKNTSDKKITCITVHGIRTRGAWQEDLHKIINSTTDSVSFESYKYGYFTIFSFMVPFFRNLRIRHFYKELRQLNTSDRDIYIFSHSFGTYIVVRALEKLIKNRKRINLKLLVLSGSVLPSSYSFKNILDNYDTTVVNDCGCNDRILLLSEVFVPNTGMAGRIGFYGLNNERFVNRFFKGGHSHYFNNDLSFMEKHWVPLFSFPKNINVIDERVDRILVSGIGEKAISLFGKSKEIIYLLLIIFILFKIFS